MNYHDDRFLKHQSISCLPSDTLQNVLNVLQITSLQAEEAQIRILDQIPEDDLILVHYHKPTIETEHIRGLIIDTGAPEGAIIKCSGFPSTNDLCYENLSDVKDFLDTTLVESTVITKAYEGTILRMFQGRVTEKWYLSTHHKIDGSRSKWAGPTFGEMFAEVWGDSKISGEKDRGYVFLVSHPENRLVCHIPRACIRLVGIFTPGKIGGIDNRLDPNNFRELPPSVEIQLPICQSRTSTEDVLKEYTALDPMEYAGLLFTTHLDDQKIKCYKLTPPEYNSLRQLRGNEPNLRLRYLEFKIEDECIDTGNVERIRILFPEKTTLFNEIEGDYALLPIYLRGLYNSRYKRGEFTHLPREEHYVLETTRQNYDSDFDILENIQDTLVTSNARQINAMIRRMRESRLKNNITI